MKTFEKKDLEDVIRDFKDEELIFSNESQFQFELGRRLEQKGFNVLFEVLSKNEKEKGKYYTDLIVDLEDDNYVAIELKYKSAEKPEASKVDGFCKSIGAFIYETKGGKSFIFPQGAVDEGSYYFVNDIRRLEKLIKCDIYLNFDKNKTVSKGFAVIIANGREKSKSAYWKGHNNTVFEAFSLEDKTEIKGGEELRWKPGCKHDKWNTITLKSNYKIEWKDYYNPKKSEYPMKYLIVEVKKSE